MGAASSSPAGAELVRRLGSASAAERRAAARAAAARLAARAAAAPAARRSAPDPLFGRALRAHAPALAARLAAAAARPAADRAAADAVLAALDAIAALATLFRAAEDQRGGGGGARGGHDGRRGAGGAGRGAGGAGGRGYHARRGGGGGAATRNGGVGGRGNDDGGGGDNGGGSNDDDDDDDVKNDQEEERDQLYRMAAGLRKRALPLLVARLFDADLRIADAAKQALVKCCSVNVVASAAWMPTAQRALAYRANPNAEWALTELLDSLSTLMHCVLYQTVVVVGAAGTGGAQSGVGRSGGRAVSHQPPRMPRTAALAPTRQPAAAAAAAAARHGDHHDHVQLFNGDDDNDDDQQHQQKLQGPGMHHHRQPKQQQQQQQKRRHHREQMLHDDDNARRHQRTYQQQQQLQLDQPRVPLLATASTAIVTTAVQGRRPSGDRVTVSIANVSFSTPAGSSQAASSGAAATAAAAASVSGAAGAPKHASARRLSIPRRVSSTFALRSRRRSNSEQLKHDEQQLELRHQRHQYSLLRGTRHQRSQSPSRVSSPAPSSYSTPVSRHHSQSLAQARSASVRTHRRGIVDHSGAERGRLPRMNSASVSAPVIANGPDDDYCDSDGEEEGVECSDNRGDGRKNKDRVPAYLRRDMRSAMACLASLLICPTTPPAADALVASEIVSVLVNARSGHRARAAAIDLDRYRAFGMHAFVDYAPTLYQVVLTTLFRIPDAGGALPHATCHPRTAASCLTLLAALIEHAPEACSPRAPLIEGLSARANFLLAKVADKVSHASNMDCADGISGAPESLASKRQRDGVHLQQEGDTLSSENSSTHPDIQSSSAARKRPLDSDAVRDDLAAAVECLKNVVRSCPSNCRDVQSEHVADVSLRAVCAAGGRLVSARGLRIFLALQTDQAAVEILRAWHSVAHVSPRGVLWVGGPSYCSAVALLGSFASRVAIVNALRDQMKNDRTAAAIGRPNGRTLVGVDTVVQSDSLTDPVEDRSSCGVVLASRFAGQHEATQADAGRGSHASYNDSHVLSSQQTSQMEKGSEKIRRRPGTPPSSSFMRRKRDLALSSSAANMIPTSLWFAEMAQHDIMPDLGGGDDLHDVDSALVGLDVVDVDDFYDDDDEDENKDNDSFASKSSEKGEALDVDEADKLGSPRGVASNAVRGDAGKSDHMRRACQIVRSPSEVDQRFNPRANLLGLEVEEENIQQDVFHACVSTLVAQCGVQALAHDLFRAIVHEFACDPRMEQYSATQVTITDHAPVDPLIAKLRQSGVGQNGICAATPCQAMSGGTTRTQVRSAPLAKRKGIYSQQCLDGLRININADGELRHGACREVKEILSASAVAMGGWYRHCVLPESVTPSINNICGTSSSRSSSTCSLSSPTFTANLAFSEGSEEEKVARSQGWRRQHGDRLETASAESSFGGMVLDGGVLDEFVGTVAVLFRSLVAALGHENVQDRDREESAMFGSLSRDVEASQAPVVSYVFQRALSLVLGEECSHAGNRSQSLPRSGAARTAGGDQSLSGPAAGHDGEDEEESKTRKKKEKKTLGDDGTDVDNNEHVSDAVAARLRAEIASLREELAGVRAQLDESPRRRPRRPHAPTLRPQPTAAPMVAPERRHSVRTRSDRRIAPIPLPRRWSLHPGVDARVERA